MMFNSSVFHSSHLSLGPQVNRRFALQVGEGQTITMNKNLLCSRRCSRISCSKSVCVCFFPECVAKGSRLTWESEGRAVFAGRCFPVRNRSQPSATVRKCSNPAPMALPLGRALKSDFSWMCHVSVCAAIPL